MLDGLSTAVPDARVTSTDIPLVGAVGEFMLATGVKPRTDGPLVGHGVSLDQFDLKRGPVDFFGSPIVANRWDIGAAVPS